MKHGKEVRNRMAISLKAARVNARLTQQDVCERLREQGYQTAKSTLVSWESEKTFPPVPIFKTLCCIYKCDMDDISIPETLT